MNQIADHIAPDHASLELQERLRSATIGRYDIYGQLGRGGMAVVYLALDLALNRKVAIKAILPDVASYSGAVERFRREVQTSASLSHPHIIPIFAVGDDPKLAYFVMKYVDGRGLDAVIRDDGAQSPDFVQTILQQVGSALDHAHRNGVVHRDVKSANIMLDDGGWALLTDFGIAKATDAPGLTSSGMIVGTPSYMSPEQFSGGHVGPAADQYALGCVAFELLAGRRPMIGATIAELMKSHLLEPPPRLIELVSDCPPELDACIQRMLAKQPEERFASISDALTTLQAPSKDAQERVSTTMSMLARSSSHLRPIISQPLSPTPGTLRASQQKTNSVAALANHWSPLRFGSIMATIALVLASLIVTWPEVEEPTPDSGTQTSILAADSVTFADTTPKDLISSDETQTESQGSTRLPEGRAPAEGRRTESSSSDQNASRLTRKTPPQSAVTAPTSDSNALVGTPPIDSLTPGRARSDDLLAPADSTLLPATIPSATLIIGTKLIGGFLYIDNDQIIPLETGRIMTFQLSPGTHRLRVTTNGCLNPWEQQVEARAGQTLTFNYRTPQCDPRS